MSEEWIPNEYYAVEYYPKTLDDVKLEILGCVDSYKKFSIRKASQRDLITLGDIFCRLRNKYLLFDGDEIAMYKTLFDHYDKETMNWVLSLVPDIKESIMEKLKE